MQLSDVISERKSVRNFSDRAVADSDIEAILRAGIQAPSAGNIQPWRFTVVKSEAARERLNAAVGQRWAAAAPVVIVVSLDPRPVNARYSSRGLTLYGIQDCAAATENMLLKAVDLGLASCWIGAFDETKVAEALGLKRPITPVTLLPIGYSAQGSGKQSRRPLDEVVSWI